MDRIEIKLSIHHAICGEDYEYGKLEEHLQNDCKVVKILREDLMAWLVYFMCFAAFIFTFIVLL